MIIIFIIYIFIIYIFIYLILFSINKYIKNNYLYTESFSGDNKKNDSIVFNFSDSVGFYSNLFFLINNYIYCKKNNLNFKINDSKWLFKKDKGWEDYFLNINLNNDKPNNNIQIKTHLNISEEYPIYEYKNILSDFYKYNENTIMEINNTKTKLELKNGEYDSIFIRRGDKLSAESKYIDTKEYFDYLLKINPNCKKIFLQTDDYNCFLDLKKLVENKNINVYTLCEENSFGTIVNTSEKNKFMNSSNDSKNKNYEYMSKINNKISNTKTVSEMNSDERYKHTITMIVGVDLLINSNICVLDYQSNVSRFVKLAHNNINNVYDIISKTNNIDLNKKVCPAYSF
jgi:hypothetical protein